MLTELPQQDGVLAWDQALPQLSPEMQWWLTALVEGQLALWGPLAGAQNHTGL
ncbi:MAG: hypothetical protein ACUVSQ_02300 [Pseudanabaenaceae cyanobacterium]